MLVSTSWLRKYVQIPVDTGTLTEDLTMAGINVEHCTPSTIGSGGFVVGHVLEVAKHPGADLLSVCKVKIGPDEEREIVCGASNVAGGQFVPVALPGATLQDGTKIRKTRIRGVVSDGMICSERELGLGEEALGIMVLEGTYAPGTPLEKVLSTPGEVLEIEITPNRPDLLSHIGTAREIAALYELSLDLPAPRISERESSPVEIEVADAEDCPRYVGRIVRGVKVGPSPPWLSAALEAVGLHSVNNVVDVTNYVMMEMGQPTHAFDLNQIRGGKIIVRRGQPGERMDALNGETYELDEAHLVIADGRGAVAVAGVIGGVPSSVTEETTDVLIESACFHPTLVRRTRKSLGLSTEASYRFERGVDREVCRLASDRACELILEVAGGTAGGITDVYGERYVPRTVEIRRENTQRLLGVKISVNEITHLLERLHFRIVSLTKGAVAVEPPSYRLDIQEEADLIEEVARLYGYNRIGRGWTFRCTAYAERDPFERFTERVADHLCARGFTEVLTSSFTDGSEVELWSWPEGDPRRSPLRIRNPLNINHVCLRTSLIPGMMEVIRKNMDYGIRKMKIFQIGRIFLCPGGRKGLPEERVILGLVMTSPADIDFWNDLKGSTDLYDIKREIELISQTFDVAIGGAFRYDFDKETGRFTYSTKAATLINGGVVEGRIARRYEFTEPVWYASMDLSQIYRLRAPKKRLGEIPEFPASRRDLSLVAGEDVSFKQVEKALVSQGGGLLESLQIFDVYQGEQIPKGSIAYGVRLIFRSKERTLTDKEIDKIIDKMVSKLRREQGVVLRS